MSICILVPSRGRPERAKLMAESVFATAENKDGVSVVFIVDADDPRAREYEPLAGYVGHFVRWMPERVGYTASLNHVTNYTLLAHPEVTILGAFGDDVLFRTKGWDRLIEDALSTPGIAYGNDLVHAAGHPTAIFMSSVIAKALGYLAIPQSRHLWVDDAWKLLGQKTGTLRYRPDVIVEHCHPAVGKAAWDATYESVYDSDLGHKDHLGFLDWEANHAESDAAKVRAVL